MNWRDAAFGLAATLALVGLTAVLTPLLDATALGVGDLESALALGAVATGLALLRRWYRTSPTGHEPPERERLAPVSVPGRDVDELLRLAASSSGEVARYYRGQARDRLQAVAVDVLTTRRDLEASDARERLLIGSWTDDPVATRFFTAGEDRGTVRDLVPGAGREHPTYRRARRAVAALRAIAGSEGEG